MTISQPITPSSPTIPPVPTPPEQPIVAPLEPVSQKKSPLTAILLTLLILATGTAVYFYSRLPKADPPWVDTTQSQPTASAIASASTDPTASWKTYTNDGFGFSFRYPTDASIIKDNIDNREIVLNRFIVYVDQSTSSLEDYVNLLRNANSSNPLYGARPIGSIEWIGFYKNMPAHYLSIKNGQNIYNILISPVEELVKYNQEETLLLAQILQTFQFTDQAIFTNNQEDNTFTKPPIGYITDIKFGYNNYILTVDYIDYIEDNSAPSGYRIDNSSNQTVTIQTDVPGSTPKIIMQTYSHTADGNFAFNQEITFGQFLEAYNNQHELWSTTPFWFDLLEDTVIVITQ